MTKEELTKELFSYPKEERDRLMNIIEGIYLVDPRECEVFDYYDKHGFYSEEARYFSLENFTLIFTLLRSNSVLDDFRTIDTLIDMYKSGADINLDLVSLILQIGEEFCIGHYMKKIEEIDLVKLHSYKDEIKKEFLNSGNIDLDQIEESLE